MQGRMHPNIIINILQLFCLTHDHLSSSTYSLITYTHHAASNLPIKSLVAKQWPTKIIIVSNLTSKVAL